MPNFVNRPVGREGPNVPYKNESGSNPVLRGMQLAAVSSIIARSSFVQNILWSLNRFGSLKDIPELEHYEPRFMPNVIPLESPPPTPVALTELAVPARRAGSTNFYTSGDLHALYKSGKLTPVDVVEALLPLIRRDTKPAGAFSTAFIDSKVELIRQAAEASTARYKAGAPLSPLDGVPLGVKDEFDMAGYKRTMGATVDFTDAEDRTSWCVQKWLDAGGIVVGKTNMHELGLDTSGNNPHWGTPRNPHNAGYYPGGSSSGSAVAVAASLCPIAMGTDGGGSVRLPASFCGVYGLKTSQGRVSAASGPEFVMSVVVEGPLAASVDDLALAYRIMAQPDPRSQCSSVFPTALRAPPAQTTTTNSKKRIGIMQDWVARSDPAVLGMFRAAVAYYEKQHGYEVVPITIPLLPAGQKAHAVTILSESRSRLSRAQIAGLSWPSQNSLHVAGGCASANDFLFAQRMRNLLMEHLAWLWDRYPGLLVLTPTTPCAGWKIARESDITAGYGLFDGDTTLRTMEYVFLANFTGAPAISCPMGYTDENVPVGLMAMAEWGAEEQLLAFAKEGEGALAGEGGIRRPKGGEWLDALVAAKGAE